jgi:hypothetical protein
MKSIKLLQYFLLLTVIFGCTNIYSQVFRFYEGEQKPSSEVAVITILKDKKAPIFLFSINDSTGSYFKAEKFFFNNLGDYSCAISVLPGKYRLELGSINTARRYVSFEAKPDKIYLVKEENGNFAVFDKKKSVVETEITIVKEYSTSEIYKSEPVPAFINEGLKINCDIDNCTFNVNILKIDGLVGYNKANGEFVGDGADQTVVRLRKDWADNNTPVTSGIHIVEYVVTASLYTTSTGIILHNSPKPQKVSFNFEAGKKYQLTGKAIFGNIYSATAPLITDLTFVEFKK